MRNAYATEIVGKNQTYCTVVQNKRFQNSPSGPRGRLETTTEMLKIQGREGIPIIIIMYVSNNIYYKKKKQKTYE